MPPITVAALYQFTPISDLTRLQEDLKIACKKEEIKGSLLLSFEGINGTIAGSQEAIRRLRIRLESHFDDLEYKESWAQEMPFRRLKVMIKKEIVTLGVPGVDPSQTVGTYVAPQDWNALISDPEVFVVDARNDYEVQIGSFQGAANPKTRSFTEFPTFVQELDKTKHRKVAMFCTGGIRCEKASSYMLSQGFDEVYHLKGGILKDLEIVPPETSLWEGECFVFDGRVSVGHGLALGEYELCYGCRHVLSEEDKQSPLFELGVCCAHCSRTMSHEKRTSFRERHRQEMLARERGTQHVGASIRQHENC